jgi:hypothetical protein
LARFLAVEAGYTRSWLQRAVKSCAHRRIHFVIFDEAGGGGGVRGQIGPWAGHAGGALQVVVKARAAIMTVAVMDLIFIVFCVFGMLADSFSFCITA